jgi:hypothetical protein
VGWPDTVRLHSKGRGVLILVGRKVASRRIDVMQALGRVLTRLLIAIGEVSGTSGGLGSFIMG